MAFADWCQRGNICCRAERLGMREGSSKMPEWCGKFVGVGFGVWGLGFRVWGLGFGVEDMGFGVLG